jgi:hypothetical protein
MSFEIQIQKDYVAKRLASRQLPSEGWAYIAFRNVK